MQVIFECYVYENIRNVHLNKLHDISFQDQVFSMLKKKKKNTQENNLVAFENTSFKQRKCSRKD